MASFRLLEMHARELADQSEDWSVWLWKPLPAGQPPTAWRLTGACAPVRKVGPLKGKPALHRRYRDTEQTVIVPVADHARWCVLWSMKTGLCAECGGDGQRAKAGRLANGAITPNAECLACAGTGRAKREAS